MAYSMIATAFPLVVLGVLLISHGAAAERRAEPPISHTEMQCDIPWNAAASFCTITDLYYWNETFYYAVPGLPNELQYYTPVFVFPHSSKRPSGLLKPILMREMQDIIRNKGNETVENGILLYRSYPKGMYHFVWETVANLHMLACKVFGKCKYDPEEEDLRVFYLDKHDVDESAAHLKAEKCITTKPSIKYKHTAVEKPLHIKKATFGVGPEAFGQPATIGNRAAPLDEIRQSLIQRMRQCMGLPAEPPAVKELQEHIVTIVQRSRGKVGRAISNVDKVKEWFEENLHGFKVQVEEIEGKTLEEQAAVLAHSTVVVSTHGGQMVNALYLPNNSVILELEQAATPENDFYKSVVFQQLRPWLNVHHKFMTPTSSKSVDISKRSALLKRKSFEKLKSSQQRTWLKDPHCDYKWLESQDLGEVCQYDWIQQHTDIIVDEGLVADAAEPVKAWLHEHGVNASSE